MICYEFVSLCTVQGSIFNSYVCTTAKNFMMLKLFLSIFDEQAGDYVSLSHYFFEMKLF